MSNRKREYGFTLNNWSEAERAMLTLEHMNALYIVFGEEKAETGTPHLQGYLYFPSARTMTSVVAKCPRLSLKPVINKQQCILYCMKGEQTHAEWDQYKENGPNYGKNAVVTELGDRPSQGKRTDLIQVCDMIKQGASIHQIVTEHPDTYAKFHGGIDKIKAILSAPVSFPNPDFPPRCPLIEDFRTLIIRGARQIGKTEYAAWHFPDGYLQVENIDDLKLFNPDRHHGIIFDDSSISHIPLNSQKHLLDWNRDRHIHCRFFNAFIPKHTRKIFTCNLDAFPVSVGQGDSYEAIMERVVVYRAQFVDGKFFVTKEQ